MMSMKRFLILPLLLCFAACQNNGDTGEPTYDTNKVLNEHFDREFLKFCLELFDTNNDFQLTYGEIKDVQELDVSFLRDATLEGIEYFTGLELFRCEDIGYVHNSIRSADFSSNKKLRVIRAQQSSLTGLTLDNPELKKIYLGGNDVYELDVRKCPKLDSLSCWKGNRGGITSIDLSNNPELTFLALGAHPLTELDLSNNKKIAILGFSGLTSIDLAGRLALKELIIDNTGIRHLDLSGCPALEVLRGYDLSNTESIDIRDSKQLHNLRLDNFTGKLYVWTGFSLSVGSGVEVVYGGE